MITLSEMFKPVVVRERFKTPCSHKINYYIVDGNTYEVRELLKKCCCKWVPEEKVWLVHDEGMYMFLVLLKEYGMAAGMTERLAPLGLAQRFQELLKDRTVLELAGLLKKCKFRIEER
jgi:hypothetical protein